jgi:uncharacterized protein YggT (Ycf19 family)
MTDDEHDLAGWGLRFTRVLVWLVYAYVVLASTILTIAFFLLLFNASTAAAFTQWVYRSADRVMEPFRGIFPTAVGENGAVLDFAVLFAIIMYGILAAAVGALLAYLDRKTQEHRAALAWSQAQSGRTAHEAPHER